MTEVTSTAELAEALAAPAALLVKYSLSCSISRAAMKQIEEVVRREPDLPIYMLNVNAARAVSDEAEERLGVEHHSPQAILVKHGEAVWNASHHGVRAREILTRLGGGDA